jgi:hypothetical protein
MREEVRVNASEEKGEKETVSTVFKVCRKNIPDERR